MLSFEQALGRLLADVEPLMQERLPVAQADGRVLARELVAQADLPGYDYSAMDGYAVCSGSLQGTSPWRLQVRGESRTGQPPPALQAECSCRIFTGAMIPAGADAVVMQEDVVRHGDEIELVSAPKPGSHVRRRGADLRAGALAIPEGTRLGPGHLGLAASLDAAWLWVARRPTVTILSTGDELRHAGEPHQPARLPESVSVAIAAMATRAGATVRVAPFAPDDAATTRALVAEAMRGSDLLVTIGGVSVGDHDVVRGALEEAGVRLDFWRVKIKPGKPVAVGRGAGTRVLGLPGNPTSAQVSFALFGMPLLRAMQRDRHPEAPRLRARLLEAVEPSSDRLELRRGALEMCGCELAARPLPNQASGATTSMAQADCLLLVPAGTATLQAGAEVELIRLSDV